MMKFDADATLNTIVSTLLPKGSGPTKGLRVTVSYGLSDYSEDDAEETATLTFLFRCTFNYVTVWSGEGHHPSPGSYRFVGHHDSGWRSCIRSELAELEEACKVEFEKNYGKRPKATPYARIHDISLVEIDADDKIVKAVKK